MDDNLARSEWHICEFLQSIPSPAFFKNTINGKVLYNQSFNNFVPQEMKRLIDLAGEDADNVVLADSYGGKHKTILTRLPYTDPGRNIQGILGTVSEVVQTEIITNQEKDSSLFKNDILQESQYRLLVENINDAIFVLDENGYFTYMSPVIKEKSMSLVESFVNNHFTESFDAQDMEGLKNYFEEVLKGRSKPYDFKTISKKGKINEYIVSIKQHCVEGRAPQYIGILSDVNWRRKLELELKRAKMQNEKADNAKKVFIANMSHEVRTPLNGIVGMVDLLYTTNLNSIQKEYLDMVKISANNLLRLINNVINVSKIHAGNMEVFETEFFLRDLIYTTVEAYAWPAHKKQLEITCDIHEDVPDIVWGDEIKIAQVFGNLIDNAVKFTDKGEINIIVENIEKNDECNSRIRFSVKDSGVGIEKEKVKIIFENFGKIHSNSTTKYGGSGLGLAVSRNMVKLMKGDIWVTTKLDEGSVFCIELNLKKSSKDNAERVELNDIRLLIIDDNETSKNILSKKLRQWGAQVETVNTKEEFNKIIKKHSKQSGYFNMILVDSKIGDIKGYELIKENTQYISESSNIVFMLTTDSLCEDINKCLTIGKCRYISKPIRENELIRLLEKTQLISKI